MPRINSFIAGQSYLYLLSKSGWRYPSMSIFPRAFTSIQYVGRNEVVVTSFGKCTHRRQNRKNNSCYERTQRLLHNVNQQDIRVTMLENDGILKLSFNRLQKANSMGISMLSQLQEIIQDLNNQEKSKNIRCVILTSCSDKVFSAGADLKERTNMTIGEAANFVSSLRAALNDLAEIPMPMIACIEGAALGGGFELALAADIIVSGTNATFALPETSLAIIPGAGGTQRLPRLIGLARAKELIFTGKKIDAQTAYEYGIVQHIVEAGKAEDKAYDIGKLIAKNGPLAIRAAKKSVNHGSYLDLKDGLEIEKACYGSIIPTKDRLEGLAAFKEKRKPLYKGE